MLSKYILGFKFQIRYGEMKHNDYFTERRGMLYCVALNGIFYGLSCNVLVSCISQYHAVYRAPWNANTYDILAIYILRNIVEFYETA